MVTIKSDRELNAMRKAGRIVAEVLRMIGKEVAPGMRTQDLDDMAAKFIEQRAVGLMLFPGLIKINGRTLKMRQFAFIESRADFSSQSKKHGFLSIGMRTTGVNRQSRLL